MMNLIYLPLLSKTNASRFYMALPPTSRKERITNRARALAALLLPLAALAVVALVASKLLHAGPQIAVGRA